jgi:hypothetical protein
MIWTMLWNLLCSTIRIVLWLILPRPMFRAVLLSWRSLWTAKSTSQSPATRAV